MNELLKRIDESIDTTIRKKNNTFNLDMLINFNINKINSKSSSDETTASLENILIKLFQSGFGTLVKTYCYYILSNFNHEFSPAFFTAITPEITTDMIAFDKIDPNLNALRNYMTLNEKEIIENCTQIEQIFKIPKFDFNFIVNSFYFSNFPYNLLNIFDKLNVEEYRTYKEFLKKFFLELAKVLFLPKIEDGTFINLIKILDTVVCHFVCFKNLSTKEKVINSIIVHFAEFLVANIEEIIDLMTSFDHKLLISALSFPVHLYKIYNYFRDMNNPNRKYEQAFNRYAVFLFEKLRNVIDPESFSEFCKAICEFKIIENTINPQTYSTETVELVSRFLELSDNFDKNTWFDTNMKILSKVIENIDYNEVIDLTLSLLSDTRNILNLHDRIHTIFNLFTRLIMLNIDYSNFFERESLILCLFKQDWFVFLINKESLEEKESRFRHDLFICLIEALFYAKKYILKNSEVKKYIILIKICLDIIDVCFKIIEWSDEGEAYKMYFLVLEETCLFFDDPFFCFIFGQDSEFMQMKGRVDQVLVEISKRFYNKVWQHLAFANENSKYRSLLLLSQFLNIDNTTAINTLLEVIFLRMNDIPFDKKNEKFLEQIIRACLFLGIRVHFTVRDTIITNIADFVEKIKQKYDADASIINNIRSFSENILNYLLDHKADPQIILDSKIVDKLNNEFYLIIPKDVENNISQKTFNFNNLYLINLCENSTMVIENSYEESSSTYVDYFRKYYYYPMLEYNNDFCHVAIDANMRYKFSEWKLITGISDAVHIHYMYKIDIETREIELFVKGFNSTSCVLNNVSFHIYLSKNLILSLGNNLSQYGSPYVTSKEFLVELLSPFSSYEFSVKIYSKIFEKNNISIDCTFDMLTDFTSNFTLNSDGFHIPLTDFFIPDNFALYETKKFDIFYTTLEYAFTCKCYTNCTPEEILKNINDRFVMIEYKSKSCAIDKAKSIMDKVKETQYKDYFARNSIPSNDDNAFSQSAFEENQRFNFKIKLSSYCIYNFWIYLVIIGDYNFQNNKSILNIELKSNELSPLKCISREKNIFFNELMNKQIKFY